MIYQSLSNLINAKLCEHSKHPDSILETWIKPANCRRLVAVVHGYCGDYSYSYSKLDRLL